VTIFIFCVCAYMFVSVHCFSEVLAMQSRALDHIYQIHNAATNIEFAQQMAVSSLSISALVRPACAYVQH